ncbi:Tetratricopeptide TPR_2 repeat protein [Chloroherpeton thalassium ATCC 35110]|uniref:Tetratricopeptide TPR_2 repeat protein n=1 Tax=Chloroherpeton thalassium (strain ATCC 35110 / GB-78) TaxID=517418 RepID=B3QRP8_CHLT3|nr:tetratricopeptide repeat protein [Chloroherpeton thalassium]ACF13851.1 Tetratricopeptide TPR_2 repeat protein [Chloroherpeton thalassium ATCC 35110]
MNKLFHAILIMAISGFIAAADGGCGGGSKQADTFAREGNYKKAIDIHQKEIAENPKNDEAYFNLGKVYYQMGDYVTSKSKFDSSLIVNPQSTRKSDIQELVYTMWAVSFNDGLDFYRKIFKTSSKSEQLGYADTAATKFETSIALNPDSAQSYSLLAATYEKLGKKKQAVSILESAVSKGIADTSTYVNLGNLYLTSDPVQTDKAISVLEKGKMAYPKTKSVVRQLAIAYVTADNWDKVKEASKEVLALDPNDKWMYYFAGLAEGEKDSKAGYEGAVEMYSKAIEIDSLFSEVAFNLAIAYRKLADFDEEANKSNGTKRNPYTGHYQYYEKAVQCLKPVAENDNKKIQWRLLANLYARMDQNDLAKEALEREKEAK